MRWGSPPMFFPIYKWMWDIINSSLNTEHVYPRDLIYMLWSLVDRENNFFSPMWSILTGEMVYDYLFFKDQEK